LEQEIVANSVKVAAAPPDALKQALAQVEKIQELVERRTLTPEGINHLKALILAGLKGLEALEVAHTPESLQLIRRLKDLVLTAEGNRYSQ